jgi:hypothetical protein
MVNHAACGVYGTPPHAQNYLMKGNVAYEDRTIQANTTGKQSIGTEDTRILAHYFKMCTVKTNVMALKESMNITEKNYWQQSN